MIKHSLLSSYWQQNVTAVKQSCYFFDLLPLSFISVEFVEIKRHGMICVRLENYEATKWGDSMHETAKIPLITTDVTQ